MDRVVVENNALGNKNEKPGQIYSINPLMPNALDANGDPMVVGGGIGKGGIKGPGKVTGKETTGKSNSAENAANSPKLNSQLSAQEIANGHAFDKHVLQRGEFDSLGIKTRTEFAQHVEKIINAPTDTRYYSDGRVAYLDSATRTVVIRNPSKGESTAFRPDYGIGWDNYIKRLPTQNVPPVN